MSFPKRIWKSQHPLRLLWRTGHIKEEPGLGQAGAPERSEEAPTPLEGPSPPWACAPGACTAGLGRPPLARGPRSRPARQQGRRPSSAHPVRRALTCKPAAALPWSLPGSLKENPVCVQIQETFLFPLKEDAQGGTLIASNSIRNY